MMKRLLILSLLLVAPLIVHAQHLTPEFALRLRIQNSATVDTALWFGFDPRAKAFDDTAFGEDEVPNLGPPLGEDFLAYIEYPTKDYLGTHVLIQPKPTTDSFYLQYKFHIYGGTYPVQLTWNPEQIKLPITGILITPPSANSGTLLDLSTNPPFVISVSNNISDNHDYQNWQTAVLTIFYNMRPVIPNASVADGASSSAGVIESLTAYPNPMIDRGALAVTLLESARMTITGYDVTGREVFREMKSGIAGENIIDLSGLTQAKGVMLVRVDASTAGGTESKSVVIAKE